MFNFFKKKKDNHPISNQSKKKQNNHPISNLFNDLTKTQKMSIMNMFLNIALCDNTDGTDDLREMSFLNSYISYLDVRSDQSIAYLESEGNEQMIRDLNSISKSQKEFLVIASFELMACDHPPNEIELSVTAGIFDRLGIDEEEIVRIIQKSQAMMKHFHGK